MTDTTTSPAQTDDPRTAFAAALDTAAGVLQAVTPDQLRLPTPCADWHVEDLSRHMLAIMRRVAVIAGGGDWSTTPELVTDVDAAALPDAFRAAADDVHAAFADPAMLEAPLVLPFGTLAGAAAMAVYTAEFTIHAWDLATATGQSPTWDDAATTLGLEAVRMGVPAEGRGPEMPFDPVVDTPADAPTIHQLVAWMGRNPT